MELDFGMLNEYMNALVVIACLIVGFLIKTTVKNEVVHRLIPVIVTVLGVVLCMWTAGWQIDLAVIVTGAVSGLASTGMHQIFKQLLEKHDATKEA